MERLVHTVHILEATVVLTLIRVLLVAVHVHSIVIHLALNWSKITRWSAHPQLLVLVLYLRELLLILGNGHVHELSLFALLVMESIIVSAARHAVLGPLEHFNLFAVLVFLLPHLIDPLDQVDVVLHEA